MSERERTFDLRRPVPNGNEMLGSITLREPTAGMLKEAERGRGDTSADTRKYQIDLVARVSGLSKAVVAALPVSNLNEAAYWLHKEFILSKRPADWRPDADLPRDLVVKIDPHLDLNDHRLSELRLREPTGEEGQKGLLQLRTDSYFHRRCYQIALVSVVSGEAEPVIERLPISVVVAAFEYLDNFLWDGLPIGET